MSPPAPPFGLSRRPFTHRCASPGRGACSRYLRYIEASALQEVGRHTDAVLVSQELLRDLGDELEPMWRVKALSVMAEASATLGGHAAAIAALARADWLLRAINPRPYGHLSASLAVALALRSLNLLEQAEAALAAIGPGHGPEIDGIVAHGLASLSAYWGTGLLLVGRPSEAVAHFAATGSRARRMHRLAVAAGDEQMLARAGVLEAYAVMRLGDPELAAARVRCVQGIFGAQPELLETQLMHLVLARSAGVAGPAGDRADPAVGVAAVGRVIRYGGDEFLVLPDGGPEVALRVAERVLRAVAERPWSEIAPGLRLAVPIGVAHATEDAEDLLAAADAALLAAKRAGRNRISVA